ncbi:MAG: hypothetical protein HN764_06610 [Gammaproteobacteria bacterium]|jgi:hypothetical protein|nr:hypothetical protein [Gammaproteobacteria bacterium]
MKFTLPILILQTIRIVLLSFLLSGIAFNALADAEQNDDGLKENLSRLFQSHEQLNIRLEGTFKELGKKRKEERPYSAANLIYKNEAGNDVRVELKMRVRGKNRAKKTTCSFPPLKLNFKKKTLEGTIFEGEDKLKLVTHCKNSSSYEQYVLLEYLNYRMHNLLTEYSLRPRLVTVEYYDTGSEKVIATKFGFFIEDKGRMASRVGAELIKVKRINKEQYNQPLLHLATIFEYMLGNTDYSVALGPPNEDCCHNAIPLLSSDGSMIPVPYDFDATGIVNPPYVSPPKNLKIKSVRQRRYRGYCQDIDGFKSNFTVFQEQRGAIFDLYNNQEGLTSSSQKKTLSYLEKFYNSISDEEKIASEFIKRCRT